MILDYCKDAQAEGTPRGFLEIAYHTHDLAEWARDHILDQLAEMRKLQVNGPLTDDMKELGAQVKEAMRAASLLS